MTRQIKAGTADVSINIRIVDSTDGTPETGVEHNTSGIDLWYRREGAAKVSITEVALAALTTSHTDGGIEHIGDGYYRLDLPDAACAAGATGVQVGGTVTGMVVLGEYIELVAYDPYDTVRLGLTALPNAAADAAGGLPISDAGGLDLDGLNTNVSSILTDTGTTLDGKINDILTDTGTTLPATLSTIAGYIDTEVGAIKTVTDALPDAGALTSLATAAALATVDSNVDAILVDTGTTLDGKIDAIKAVTDALPDSGALSSLATAAALATVDGNVDAIKVITDALTSAAAAKLALSAGTIVTGTVDTGTFSSTTTAFEADDITEATADHFIGRTIIFTSGALVYQATDITDYSLEGSNGRFTVTALTEAPANDVTFIIV